MTDDDRERIRRTHLSADEVAALLAAGEALRERVAREVAMLRPDEADMEWDPLSAPIDEVDAQLRAMGMDPTDVGRRGAELVGRLKSELLRGGGET